MAGLNYLVLALSVVLVLGTFMARRRPTRVVLRVIGLGLMALAIFGPKLG